MRPRDLEIELKRTNRRLNQLKELSAMATRFAFWRKCYRRKDQCNGLRTLSYYELLRKSKIPTRSGVHLAFRETDKCRQNAQKQQHLVGRMDRPTYKLFNHFWIPLKLRVREWEKFFLTVRNEKKNFLSEILTEKWENSETRTYKFLI